MNIKTSIQIFIIFIIFIIFTSLYVRYFNKSSKSLEKIITLQEEKVNKDNSSNYISDVNYASFDVSGNEYQITATQAQIDVNSPDVMFLENVVANVFMLNSKDVKITANFGKYNTKNHDTIFSKNVVIIYPEHKITGEYLDFSFLNNFGNISTNVIYIGENRSLFADKAEINLTTKDTKIYMDDNSRKVLIKSTK
jgi:LPS export ABC transporter protein LptC